MASGCIVGYCYLCDMPVFEDEASWNDTIYKFKHSYCKSNKQLEIENKALRNEIEEYKRWLSGTHNIV